MVDLYETKGYGNFIQNIDNTYTEESVLTESGKIGYRSRKPVLFQIHTYDYLRTDDVIAKCISLGREKS